jgi:putative two-component system response regulator
MEATYARHVAGISDRARASRRIDDHDLAAAVVLALGLVVERRDENTEGHCQRLASYAVATGAMVGLGRDDLETLFRGGYLHDLGKIAIPDGILLKPGALTAAEYAVMQLHTVIGDAVCARFRLLQPVRPIVRWHHERLDGSGYPDGLKGDRIPLSAQIIGIADVYDALTSARPYKAARPPAEACQTLMDEARRGWRRRDLVEAFIRTVAEGAIRAAGRLAA